MAEWLEKLTVKIDADTSSFRKELKRAQGLGRSFASTLSTGLEGLVFKGKSFRDTLRSIALSMSKLAFKAAFKPLENNLSSLFTNVFAAGFRGFSNGGVVSRAMPVPFASGGVIASPTTFPLRDGQIGVAGERGAEAILPLSRGADGRLGVKTQGGGGVAVTFNVQTPDVESFNRSEAQIAAMLARAVDRGERKL